MAHAVIRQKTISMPGLVPGSRFDNGPGPFSAADALVLYALKLTNQARACIPVGEFAAALDRVRDGDVHKMAALRFWATLCSSQRFESEAAAAADARSRIELAKKMPEIFDADLLTNDFKSYITVKVTERTRVVNQRLRGPLEAANAWQRAMDSDQKFQQSVRDANQRTQTARDSYRVQLDAEAAAAAAERAVASGR